MAKPEDMGRPPDFHETTANAEGYAMVAEKMLDLLKCTEKCLERVRTLSSPRFNTKQCDYLRNKLELVVGSARSFLEVSRVEHYGPGSSVYAAMPAETFKLMLVRAKEIESFILECSGEKWIQAAMTLTNVWEYVASIGFNLELCRVVFGKERGAGGAGGVLTLEQVMAINDEEVGIVKEMAPVDGDTLFRKVVGDLTQKSLGTNEKELAAHLLQRLIKVGAVTPLMVSESSGSSWYSDICNSVLSLVSRDARQIGRSSDTVVEKVTWLGKPVAKKTFYGSGNEIFKKECDILAQLNHPNITSLFCCEQGPRRCSIVMELMDQDLYQLINERPSDSPPFTISEAVDIMLEIGEGVNYLHQKDISHRDLKSHNILVKNVLTRQSNVEVRYVRTKVADFGISKAKSAHTTSANQTNNTGTNRWMAPEVISLDRNNEEIRSSEPKRPHKTDVYSFAMLCFEILTGEVPFSEISDCYPKTIKERILNGDRPDLPAECPHILKALIQECWHETPKERPSFPIICSKLKYVKYLLMAGLDANEDPHPTDANEDPHPTDANEDPHPTAESTNVYVEDELDEEISARAADIGPPNQSRASSSNHSVPRTWDNGLNTREQDIFLDLALIWVNKNRFQDGEGRFEWDWLCKIHGMSVVDMKKSVIALQRKGLLENVGEVEKLEFRIHDSYVKFAEVVAQHGHLSERSLLLDKNGIDVPHELLKEPQGLCWSSLTRIIIKSSRVQSLKRANLHFCRNVEVLDLDSCEELEEVDVEGMVHLRCIMVTKCEGLRTLRGLEKLSDLIILRCKDCSNLKDLNLKKTSNDFVGFKQLEHLDVSGCHNLSSLDGIGRAATLQHLNASGCWNLKELLREDFVGLKQLQHLNVSGYLNLSSLDGIGCVTTLQYLDASWCRSLKDLLREDFLGLKQLQHLDVRGCLDLSSLDGIACAIALQHLNASRCRNLKELLREDFGGLKQLQHLDVSRCENLSSLDGIGHMTALQHLNASGCSNLKELLREDFVSLKQLQHLDVSRCENLSSLDGIGHMTALQHLNASGCSNLKELLREDFVGLKQLQHLNVSGCRSLSSLDGIGHVTALQHLDVSYCANLWLPRDNFVGLMQQLQYIHVDGCRNSLSYAL